MSASTYIAKILASKLLSKVANEDNIRNIVLLVVIIISALLILVLMVGYMIFIPNNSIINNSIFKEIKDKYNNVNNGELTFIGKFPFPLQHADNYIITAEYGYYDPFNIGKLYKHTGIDLVTIHHDNVLAIADATVTFSGIQSGYGNCIELKHSYNGEIFYSFYAHLSKRLVETGQSINCGTVIGLEGGDPFSDTNAGNSTGHHLHFEIRTNTGFGNDINPKEYIIGGDK